MFATATGSLIALGGATALDTLGSKALASAKNPGDVQKLGIYLQRSILLLGLQFVVTSAPLWWFSSYLFRALGQEPDFTKVTEQYLRILIPGGIFQIMAECLKRFLQIQNMSDTVGMMIAISSVIGIAANYILIRVLGMGVLGASLSHVLYHFSTAVLLVACVWWNRRARAGWGRFSSETFEDCWTFIKLALSGILTITTEFWCFEIIALMAANLNEISIGAQSIIMASDQILACVPIGMGVAAAHRIGFLLGSGDHKGARFMARIPYILACLVGLTEALIIIAARNVYGYLYSTSSEVE